MAIDDFQDLYEIVKTITFELKTVQEHQNTNFTKTQNLIQEKYFTENKIAKDQHNEEVLLEFGHKIVNFTENLVVNFEKGNILLRALEVNKQLVEKCDRQLFYKLKKITKITAINPNTNTPYPAPVKFSDLNSLDLVCKMAKDEKCYFLTIKLSQLVSKIDFYGEKINKDLVSKNNQNTIHLYSGNVQFYANWRACLSNLKDLMEILGLISKNQKAENTLTEPKWSKTEKILSEIEFIKSEFAKLENDLKMLDDKINEEAKKLIIFTSLNGRAVNKDQSKIEFEYQKVLQLERQIKTLTTELSAINEQKFRVVEKLDTVLKENIESLKILNDKYILELFQRSCRGEKLENDDYWCVKEFKFSKRILKYIKFSGVLTTSNGEYRKRNGKEEWVYSEILNYGKPNEKVASNLPKIQTHPNYENFKNEYLNYQSFCDEKFKKSQELGNAKNLFNAINREVLRQKEMDYLSVLIRDSEFYYLALIQKDFAKTNQIIEKLKQNPTENWQMLDYHKITFKALEKLALLDKSTFDINGESINFEIKKIYQSKSFKPKNQDQLASYQEKQNLQRLIEYCKNCLVKIPEAKLYNFKFQEAEKYNSLEEFADEVDKQGYKSSWNNLNKEYLFELEKQEGENVLIFKLHNQDFRRDKIQDKTRKINLFTKYWLDAMELGQQIRIIPEIDIFKRNKEENIVLKKNKEKQQLINKDGTETVSKFRNYQNKIYGAFKLQFYPKNNLLIDQHKQFEEINHAIKDRNTKENQTYYLGLDRGENELVSYCLIDSNKQLIKNGDWTKFKDFDYTQSLQSYQQKKQELFEKYAEVSACNNLEQKTILEDEAKKLQKDFDTEGLLAAETIKKGYCSYLINEINQILVEYPSTYIVLEDLDRKFNEDGTPKVKEDESLDNKIKNLEKTMGATAYQAIENAIVNKFKYYVVKSEQYNGQQFVPNIAKIEDLRVKDDVKNEDNRGKIRWIRSKDQIGNILFVDEYLTSNQCPNCEFNHNLAWSNSIKYRNFASFSETNNDYQLSILEFKYTFNKEFYKEKLSKYLERYCDKKTVIEQKEIDDLEHIFKPRAKNNKDFMKNLKEDYFHCVRCGFSTLNCNSEKLKNANFVIKTGDEVAAYNIAKRGLEFTLKNKK